MDNPAGSRLLVTVLFTDIAGSTALAAAMGDNAWRRLLDRHDDLVRRNIETYGGTEAGSVGDGFVATFDSPRSAIACAEAILAGAPDIGLTLRAGLHTGEIEHREGGLVAGIAVHVAARVAALAADGEILVSNTVTELVAGSELAFVPRGRHSLKGVPGARELFAVGPAAGTEQPTQLRVLLADDHPLWRETLRGLLEGSGTAIVCAQARNGEEAVSLAAEYEPDVILMDIDMPRLDGIGATAIITKTRPGSRILMLSSLSNREEVLAAVRAGASGYLLKTAEAPEIAAAIRRVHAGEVAFPAELSGLVLAELRGQSTAAVGSGLDGLTAREREILELVAGGRSNAAIGSTLHLSAKTIEAHLAAIFTKLGLESTPDNHRRVQVAVTYLTDSAARRRDNP